MSTDAGKSTLPPKLTISIVSWNTKGLLLECLKSVYRSQTSFVYEVTVVDNNSGDGSPEAVSGMFPRTRVICNGKNLGFSAANNQAIKVSRAPYVLLLNPDTVIPEDLLQKLVDFMDGNAKAGAAGPKMVFPDGIIQDSYSPYYPGLKMTLVHHGLKTPPPLEINAHGPTPVASIMGACLIARRKAIENIGLMDENFFLIFEEADWCYRMSQAGWMIYYLPECTVLHYQGQSEKQIPGIGIMETQVSLIWFIYKHYGLGPAILVSGLTVVIRIWWVAKTGIKMLLLGKTPESLSYQSENWNVLLGQGKGFLRLWKKILLGGTTCGPVSK